MHTKSTTELIAMAQAVLVSLIESHKEIEPCEIEDNLVAINSILIDASTSSSRNSVTAKANIEPKSAMAMLGDIAADIVENTSLLEVIYRNYELPPEADNAIACLIRSMQKTLDNTNEYVEHIAYPQCEEGGNADIADDIFYATVNAAKLRELAHVYNESYFSGKDSDDADCLMASLIFDNAIKVHDLLKSIEAKLS